jgi:hypothetical protein
MLRLLKLFSAFFLALAATMPLEAAQVIRGPYVQSAAADRMTVCWRTDVASTSELSYGLAADTLAVPEVQSGTRTDHAVTVTGLQPATRYYYRVQGTPDSGTPVNVGGSGYWFKTAPTLGTPAPIRIWTIGDSGYSNYDSVLSFNAYQSATAQQGKTTDVFMMLGDNAYGIGTDAEYQNAVFTRYASLLKNAPLWSAFGNHDSYSSTLPDFLGPVPYDSIFRFPTSGECGGVPSGSERYYSFDHGNVHFICLDTNTTGYYDDVPGGNFGMVDWLKADLENCSADWIIAFMHQGPYTKGKSHDSDVSWWMRKTRDYVVPILESYGADLVLHGHSHVYERSGLINGHYGMSPTFNPATMAKWPGNGSDLGAVSAAGTFIQGSAAAGGPYQKPTALANAGCVYSVVGASSSAQAWVGGSTALVNPTPHPAHIVSLSLIGSMVIDIQDNQLKAQYLDATGAVRDDFTILKGATYTLQAAVPTTEGSLSGVAFPVTRTGSTAFAEQVPVAVTLNSGDGVTPSQGLAVFTAGQSSTEVKFFPAGGPETRFEARLLATTRAVQPGATPRAGYRISGGPQVGSFGPTDPMSAATWYTSRFGAPPFSPAVWDVDDDGDGLSLLLEYALGGEPGPNNSALLPQGKIESGSFIYRYTRPPGRSDLSYQILGSADLASWPLPALSDANDGPVTTLGEPRKVELPAGSPLRFVRMKIGLLP